MFFSYLSITKLFVKIKDKEYFPCKLKSLKINLPVNTTQFRSYE